MRQNLVIIIFILFFSVLIYPQNIWKRYKISEYQISISLPKLPVRIDGNNPCLEEKEKTIPPIKMELFYGFSIITQLKPQKNQFCEKIKKFDENNFKNYLAQVYKLSDQPNFKLNGKDAVKAIIGAKTYWFINDNSNKRWFEFWTFGANEDKKEVVEFVNSLNFTKSESDIEINDGAEATIGDENVTNIEGQSGTTSLNIVVKPRANYTESARRNGVQGTITLRITFLANGGIGNVEVVNGLQDGMTEQTIKAAKKMVFIPQTKDGVYQTTTKTIQYSFTLY